MVNARREALQVRFLFIMVFSVISLVSLEAESVLVVTFPYPPLQGTSDVSDLGVDLELVDAAFGASGIDAEFSLVPTKRAIDMIEKGDAPVMIGLLIYFPVEIRDSLAVIPLFQIDFDVFYLKSRFPDGFAFRDIDDLRGYSIGVLLGGSTDIFGKEKGLAVEGAVTLDLVFRKLRAGRTDLCVANDLAGMFEIRQLFPGEEGLFAYCPEPTYITQTASAIFDRRNPRYAELEAAFRAGLKEIILNGTWEAIVSRYYAPRSIPPHLLAKAREYAAGL